MRMLVVNENIPIPVARGDGPGYLACFVDSSAIPAFVAEYSPADLGNRGNSSLVPTDDRRQQLVSVTGFIRKDTVPGLPNV